MAQAQTGFERKQSSPIAPGSRIVVRDAEWLVRRVDKTSTGGKAFSVIGVSELVRDQEALFLDEIDKPIALEPEETKIVVDSSGGYKASLLYMESLLRQTPPTDENLYIGHLAAMDKVPFQLDPAIQALQQARPRILIADSVGLGKTLECGVLLSELIRRGRGKRILVLAVKSMLTQFQKEMWSRFSIPLTRLDSLGIQRVRRQIPTNHNPFYYYDKSIISIDTLKQDAEYRSYLENAYWDIIVIDEAHNVAERGGQRSLRARLAKLLSSRSDALIMLSATPHDGKARSFASLMNMLDPTAIADPDNYTKDDIKGLFIRRFKKDIKDQVEKSFRERKISVAHCQASEIEEQAFATLSALKFARLDKHKSAGQLFKTTLEKSLFSSPEACLETLARRIKRLEAKQDPGLVADIAQLRELSQKVEQIDSDAFSKYHKLLETIRDKDKGLGWNGKDPRDRLVIFTERIKTMSFLEEHLKRDLKLKDKQVMILHGGMSDVEQQQVVEDFGKDQSPLRLLIASDVASEGINLHYLSHKMIHFDIPWSLMVFKQRNGRIDRYGQEQEPRIVYLVTDSSDDKTRGDTRILELLIQKDEEAVKNIGDPSTWMGVYDIDSEELITAQAIEDGKSAEEFEQAVSQQSYDPLASLLDPESIPTGAAANDSTRQVHSLFADDYAYLEAALRKMQEFEKLQVAYDPKTKRVDLTAPEDLKRRFEFLPPETWPEDGGFVLSADKKVIEDEIAQSRKEEKAWPSVHYLWPLNPVIGWVNDKVLAAFGRHEAPLLTLPATMLDPDEVVFVLSGLLPNLKGQPLLHSWFALSVSKGTVQKIETFAELQKRCGLGQNEIPNRGDDDKDAKKVQKMLPKVVRAAKDYMSQERKNFESAINPKLDAHLKALEGLRGKQHQQLHLRFAESRMKAKTASERKEAELRRINKLFDEFITWVEESMTTDDNPYLQVVAVLRGAAS